MRLIDGDELIMNIRNHILYDSDNGWDRYNDGLDTAIEEITDMPTVEKQAKWVVKSERTAFGRKYYICCSVCGQEYEKNVNYCPNCGSRMVADE